MNYFRKNSQSNLQLARAIEENCGINIAFYCENQRPADSTHSEHTHNCPSPDYTCIYTQTHIICIEFIDSYHCNKIVITTRTPQLSMRVGRPRVFLF